MVEHPDINTICNLVDAIERGKAKKEIAPEINFIWQEFIDRLFRAGFFIELHGPLDDLDLYFALMDERRIRGLQIGLSIETLELRFGREFPWPMFWGEPGQYSPKFRDPVHLRRLKRKYDHHK